MVFAGLLVGAASSGCLCADGAPVDAYRRWEAEAQRRAAGTDHTWFGRGGVRQMEAVHALTDIPAGTVLWRGYLTTRLVPVRSLPHTAYASSIEDVAGRVTATNIPRGEIVRVADLRETGSSPLGGVNAPDNRPLLRSGAGRAWRLVAVRIPADKAIWGFLRCHGRVAVFACAQGRAKSDADRRAAVFEVVCGALIQRLKKPDPEAIRARSRDNSACGVVWLKVTPAEAERLAQVCKWPRRLVVALDGQR